MPLYNGSWVCYPVENTQKEAISMKRQLQGIALILCGIFLILFSQFAPWFPILDYSHADLSAYGSIIIVIVGLVRMFKDNPDKQA